MSLVIVQQIWACRLSGYAALLLLLGSQSLGAGRRLGWVSPKIHLRWRRRLGIYSALMASLHLFIAWRTFLSGWLVDALRETPWTQIGLVAWCILLLLWLTSYPRLVRLLRVHSWSGLHKLAYPATALALLHALLAPWSEPRIHLGLLILWTGLLGLRMLPWRPILKR
ncbi:ferric reductase-like transmembrane domain-containing protein [bacterium]|nr:ferric reductase-like transmembrane domain-containing protein [bacterium]